MVRNNRFLVCMFITMILMGCEKTVHQDPRIDDDTEVGMEEKVSMAIIEGEVVYRERMILPPNSILTVSLLDVSKADAKADVISKQEIVLTKAPPYQFILKYAEEKIDPRMRYSIQARIENKEKLLFISDTALDPFKAGNETPMVIVKSVGSHHATSAKTHASNNMTIVSVDPLATLENTYWKLVSIGGTEVTTGKGGKERHITLRNPKNLITGFAGCNQFSGTYETKGNELSFGPLSATRRMCMSNMDVEQNFLDALGKTKYFSIHKESLVIFGEDKKPMARFNAVYF